LPGWFASPSIYDTDITNEIVFVNFQRIHDFYKMEIDDIDYALALSSATGDDDDNILTEVIFASSATLVAQAAIVFAAFAAL
jgi:hypothetical protein